LRNRKQALSFTQKEGMENPASNPVPPTPSKAPRVLALVWMILSQLLTCLVIVLPIFYLWLGVQMGDGSLPMNIGTAMFSCPALNIIPMIAAWVVYARQKTSLALILTTLPLVLACLEVLALLGMMMGIIPTP
jgi:hypothetical protein